MSIILHLKLKNVFFLLFLFSFLIIIIMLRTASFCRQSLSVVVQISFLFIYI